VRLLLLALLLPLAASAQEKSETWEMLGHMGGRTALLQLYATPQADGSARITGEYLVLPTMQRRFLEGERSKQLGVTFLKEGNSPILYGRPPMGSLQGVWKDNVFKGGRYGPAGQPREQFEFKDSFPPMDGYSANLRCEVAEGRYASTLSLNVEGGRLKQLEWRSTVQPGGHTCSVAGLEQRPDDGQMRGGLRFAAGRCSVSLRNLGEAVRVVAEDCAAMCGSQGYLEPMLIDRRGNCELLRPVQR
jgi:hypothetical protein